MVSKKLKVITILVFLLCIAVLLGGGLVTSRNLVPYPGKVIGGEKVLTDKISIMNGQKVFQKYGLMDLGSVWGHGTQRGPDFSAQALHLIGVYMREYLAQERFGLLYKSLDIEKQGIIDRAVIQEIKENKYNATSDVLTLTPSQSYAFQRVKDYYIQLFSQGDVRMQILPGTIKGIEEKSDLGSFFFWTAWTAGTKRIGANTTYTNNWPPDDSVGNRPPEGILGWTLVSILTLMIMLGLVIFIIHAYGFFGGKPENPEMGKILAQAPITPSQRKAFKFFFVVTALFLLQTIMGGIMAKYTISPGHFYGLDSITKFIPYNWAKTWHLQLAIFWIATSWVGAAIYLAPLAGGREPKAQGLLVDLLFVAILIVAVGSLFGEVLGIKGLIDKGWFWLGHQGWEYLELGRLWQLLLFVGLLFWLFIVYRAMRGHFSRGKDLGGIPQLFVYSAIVIVVFFGFGFLYGPSSHLTMADYWRWWVVHLWVESMFEFFAVAAIALLSVVLGLVDKAGALKVVYLTAILVFGSGIIGTGHHYLWFGDPPLWIGLGGVFSALEPVPLITLIARVWKEHSNMRHAGIDFPYRWPMRFLIGSSLWNFLGGGVMGFIITTPLLNYYEHGTYLTLNHGHTALMGTYGMLAISLILFSSKSLIKKEKWSDGLLGISFVGLNLGLALMFLLTLFPVGILQLQAVFTKGVWYARSPEFFTSPAVQFLGQARIVPDLIFIVIGVLPLLIFMLKGLCNLRVAEVREGESIFKPGDKVPQL